jgi:hypothetical protein
MIEAQIDLYRALVISVEKNDEGHEDWGRRVYEEVFGITPNYIVKP